MVSRRLILAAVLLASCGDNYKPTSATGDVGPQGGSLGIVGATLEIPAGALSSDVEITIQRVTDTPAGYEPLSPTFEFLPEGLTFEQPITVAFDFTGAATEAGVFWTLPGNTAEYELISTDVESARRIRASVSHFSKGFVGNRGKQPCVDGDGDTYGRNCATGPDCDDRNAAIYPGANEVCNATDDNCDGGTDEGFGVGTTCGVGACSGGVLECEPGGAARCSTMPGGSADASTTEILNSIDDDCDGTADDTFVAPDPPTNVVAIGGDAEATVSWTAPTNTGGSPITGYEVTSTPDGLTASTIGATSVVITGLTNGTSYTFTVTATNAVGTSSASSPSSAVTPVAVPDAPTDVMAVAGNAQATLSWTAPANAGGAAITGYTVTSSPGGYTVATSGATTAVVSGLANGTSYTFVVTATNVAGTGAASTPSNAVVPSTLPDAPTSVVAIAGNAQASVSWSAPPDNGSAIIGYTVTSSPDGITATTTGGGTAAVVTNLVNGTAYTFSVTATNANGVGPASAPSSPVTPATVPASPTNVVASPGNTEATVSWTAPVDTGGTAVTGYTVRASPGNISATTTGATSLVVSGLTNGTGYTFDVVASNVVGNSSPSAASNVVIPQPVVVSDFAVAPVTPNDTTMTVSWHSVVESEISVYLVQRRDPGQLAFTDVVGEGVQGAGANYAANETVPHGGSFDYRLAAELLSGDILVLTGPATVTIVGTPAAPSNVSATAENAQSRVMWTLPPTDGGSPITGYTITSIPGDITVMADATATEALVTGLSNGTTYGFIVSATNALGTGPSALSNAVTPATTPGAPTSVSALPANGAAAVSWMAPADTGGVVISGYTVTSAPEGIIATTTGATDVVVTGLTNGNAYTFTVAATNAVGDGPQSSPSTAITPITVPAAPTGVMATAENTRSTVMWTPSADDGGSAITSYTVTSSPGGITATAAGDATQVAVTGLTNGTTYTFTVAATNAAGSGPASIDSNAVTPATIPGAPTSVTAARGDTQASVSWTAPGDNGGVVVTGYTVTSSPGGLSATTTGATSVVVAGLTNGTSYTFTVVATNAVGDGPASAPSNAVTPATTPATPTAVVASAGDSQATVMWNAPTDDGGSPITSYTVTSSPGGITKTTSATKTIITGLTNGVTYTLTVAATNAAGTGSESVASNAVTLVQQAPSSSVADRFWITNGSVHTTAVRDDVLYIGGYFDYVGPPTGGLGALDAATGAVDMAFPRVSGTVSTIAPDGTGGWYIGGMFTAVDGVPRSNIARITASGTLDTTFDANATGGTVRAILPVGASVYVGGDFTGIGGAARFKLASVDATTGVASSWNPNPNGMVGTLAGSGTTIYIGGGFTQLGGQTRFGLAAVDTTSGAITAWNPSANVIGSPWSFVVTDTVVYIAGPFTTLGGQSRAYLASVDKATGAPTSWVPGLDRRAYAIALDGSTLYVGGELTSVGGITRNRAAAFDITTHTLTSWNPDANGIVSSLAVNQGTVHIGGHFTAVGGQTRKYVAGLDAVSAVPTAWSPIATGPVQSVRVAGGSILVGGNFESVGGISRSNIAALDVFTGEPTAWNPTADSTVWELAVRDSTVYAVGAFTSIGGQFRARIAALDVITGNATTWNPAANGTVYTLGLEGNVVYAGGDFTAIGGFSRNRLAAIDATTGSATAWDPNAGGRVQALTVENGIVYVGGGFTTLGGQPRNYVAAVDAAGTVTTWAPDASSTINDVAISGSTVYLVGNFTSIGGQPRSYVAAVDDTTGTATAWNPGADQQAFSVAASSGAIYVGGSFSNIGGQARSRLAALDPVSGTATSWSPPVPNNQVNWVRLVNGTLYAAGNFTAAGGDARRGIAVFEP